MLAQGAEAIIVQEGNTIIKKRLPKTYRHPKIDEKLRVSRTKREAKVLEKLQEYQIPAPKLLSQEKDTLIMSFIEGEKLRDCLEEAPEYYGEQLGELIRRLHEHDIIHGDLTTSNIMVKNKELFLIDFGLSFFSKKREDKAVDLHLLAQALESKHHSIFKETFRTVKEAYGGKDVLKQLKTVESRGRNREKFI